jgi:hypothetical protein
LQFKLIARRSFFVFSLELQGIDGSNANEISQMVIIGNSFIFLPKFIRFANQLQIRFGVGVPEQPAKKFIPEELL